MSFSTNFRSTTQMRRGLPGAAALLAGGVGFVGLVLVHVAMGSSPTALGMAVDAVAPLSTPELHDLGGEEAVAPPVLPLSTSGRTAVRGVRFADEATPVRLDVNRPRSESEWFEAFRAEELTQLQREAQDVLTVGHPSSQAIGLLLALEAKGPVAARAAFLQAMELPETAERGLSVPAFAVMRLTKNASDVEARCTLEEIAFSTGGTPSLRLRSQALAALVAETPKAERGRLRNRIGCISEPSLLASVPAF